MIRRACALAGLIAMLLQGSTGGHMLLVEHTRCAEHGELIHASEAHHHEAGAKPSTEGAAYQGASDPSSEAEHEHCAHAAEHRDALLPIAHAQLRARSIQAARSDAPDEKLVVANQATYRIAPENSPPA